MAFINEDECVCCGACVDECPVNVIHEGGGGEYYIDDDGCMGCGACIDVCPVEAISMEGDEYYDYLSSEFNTSSFWNESVLNWNNVPFLIGGYTTQGVDCSFLVYHVYSENGLYYPYYDTSAFINNDNPYFFEVLSPQEGDVVIWPGHHMGIYIANPSTPGYHLYSATLRGGVRLGPFSWWSDLHGQPRYFRRHTGGGG